MISRAFQLARRYRRLQRIVAKIEADPNAKSYTDAAMTPVVDEDAEHMGLYTQNEAARSAVERELRVAGHRGNGHHTNGNGHQGNGHAAGGHDHTHERDERPDAVGPAPGLVDQAGLGTG
jgi:hypothetical protein